METCRLVLCSRVGWIWVYDKKIDQVCDGIEIVNGPLRIQRLLLYADTLVLYDEGYCRARVL